MELVCGFAAVGVLTFLLKRAGPSDAGAMILVCLYLSCVALIFWLRSFARWYSTAGARIVISPEGIEFYSFGYGVVSAWENVRGVERTVITRNRWSGRTAQIAVECLVLRRRSLIGSRPWGA